MEPLLKKLSIAAVVLVLALQELCVGIYFYVDRTSKDFIMTDIGAAPLVYTCIVPGAAVYRNGRLSVVLYDRLTIALKLYRAGKVKKILLSGDHGTVAYDEVNQMKDFMVKNGVPADALFLDHAGFNTYNSLVRAKKVFLADDCVIVTQKFHLPRAVYIARKIGLSAYGFAADRRRYKYRNKYAVREYFARVKAFFDVAVDKKPRYLGPVISITGPSFRSWD